MRKPRPQDNNGTSIIKQGHRMMPKQFYRKGILSNSTASATTMTEQLIGAAGGSRSKSFVPIGVGSIPVQVAVGMSCACFWRGMWYILDDNLFPEDPQASALASLAGGTAGLTLSQGYVAERYVSRAKLPSSVARFAGLYCVATSCVLIWRGAWVGCDVVYEKMTRHGATEPGHMTRSGVASHVLAACGLWAFGRFASVLAPPARVCILKDSMSKAKTWKQYSETAKWFFK